MSSVNFKKCHSGTGEGSAMIRHMMRHDGKTVEYNNFDLMPELSNQNSVIQNDYNIGVDSFGELGNSQEIYESLKNRVDEIDVNLPPKRIRSDRVTMISYEIPAPAGLKSEDEDRFFKIVHDEIARMSGGHQNITPGFVHRDEVHAYFDPITKDVKMSRVHLQMAGVPFVSEKGINGKLFETRSRMKKLNQDIDLRCQKELGIKFLTGEKLERKGCSVEDLKLITQSCELDKVREEINRTQCKLKKLRLQADNLTNEIAKLEAEKKALSKKAHKELDKMKITSTLDHGR